MTTDKELPMTIIDDVYAVDNIFREMREVAQEKEFLNRGVLREYWEYILGFVKVGAGSGSTLRYSLGWEDGESAVVLRVDHSNRENWEQARIEVYVSADGGLVMNPVRFGRKRVKSRDMVLFEDDMTAQEIYQEVINALKTKLAPSSLYSPCSDL